MDGAGGPAGPMRDVSKWQQIGCLGIVFVLFCAIVWGINTEEARKTATAKEAHTTHVYISPVTGKKLVVPPRPPDVPERPPRSSYTPEPHGW